ncbi:MAG: hypothetical protein IJJ11_00725 [Methanosphaera sp.]|nr:hypothetical protein [Methanobrevibacter sp.]MBQ6443184.1 hypothetical protein [Methanosphaera sp.]
MSEKSTTDVWQRLVKRHQDARAKMIELNIKIEDGMENYLKSISENNDFTIRFEDNGAIYLNCKGDLFDLEQIFDFCDVFGLTLMLNNRTIVENHLDDKTSIRTEYLFTTHPPEVIEAEEGD